MNTTMDTIPKKFFVIDFENTGGSLWTHHKITGVGICILEETQNGKYEITEKYTTLIDPERKIPKYIEKLIGIYTKDVIGKYPKINDVFPKMEEMLSDDKIFTAHCVGVDYAMYNYLYYKKYGKFYTAKVLDTHTLVKNLLKLEKGGIGKVSEYFEIDGNHHEPDFDALVAAEIVIRSINHIKKHPEDKELFFNCFKDYPKKSHYKYLKNKNGKKRRKKKNITSNTKQ